MVTCVDLHNKWPYTLAKFCVEIPKLESCPTLEPNFDRKDEDYLQYILLAFHIDYSFAQSNLNLTLKNHTNPMDMLSRT